LAAVVAQILEAGFVDDMASEDLGIADLDGVLDRSGVVTGLG
jgi:hypothetical protein